MQLSDPVLDDPGELLRFWLWHEYRSTVRSFKLANLAKSLGAKPAAVSAWLTRHAIPSFYWNPIARHFKGESATYRVLEDEARALWEVKANQRGYIPLRALQKKRRDVAAMTSALAELRLKHPGTPGLVAEYLRQSDAAMTPRQPQRGARRAATGKDHGRRRAL